MTKKLHGLILCALILFSSPGVRAAQPVPPGTQQDSFVVFSLLIVYPDGKPAPVALKPLLASKWPALSVVDKLPDHLAGMVVKADSGADFQAPDKSSLERFGYGLTPAHLTALRAKRPYLALHFAHRAPGTLAGLRTAYQLAAHLARKNGALIWDDETRELFTAEQWDQKRLATWTESYPVVADSTVIHSYRNGELLRQITLGMNKFGLPDIVVNQISQHDSGSMASMINLLSQGLVEGAVVEKAGHFDLAIEKIANKTVREQALATLRSNAVKSAKLVLVKGSAEEGDPDNRLIEIAFDRYAGPDYNARHAALIAALFGRDDAVKYIRHDDQLREESNKARQRLAAMQSAFKHGLPTGESIQVKAPFDTDDGNREWMWVEIVRWEGDRIDGTLQNTPFGVSKLKQGQMVRIRQQDIFDYLRFFPSGRTEGNTTGDLIEKMREVKAGKRL